MQKRHTKGEEKPVNHRILALGAVFFSILMFLTGSVRCHGAGREEENMQQGEKQAEFAAKILFATDLHYLSPSLTDEGPCFQRLVESGDGKLPERSKELLEELIRVTRDVHPDALVLGGDLTYNGEKQSLEEVCEALLPLWEEGIPVLVIPGNHDIAYPYACRYVGEKAYRVEGISQEAFAERCAGFGPDRAVSVCGSSFSYVYALTDALWLLFLDANTEKKPGGLDEETLAWAKEQLDAAKEEGIAVVTVTHQNVLRQSELFYYGFIISNEEETADLLLSHQVRTNLSGHSHIQSRKTKDGLIDYCTGCMSVWPLHYGIVELYADGEALYEERELTCCLEEARDRFRVCTGRQVTDTLKDLDIPEEVRKEMIDYAVYINGQYFAGWFSPEKILGTERWKKWETYGKATFWYYYISSMLSGKK